MKDCLRLSFGIMGNAASLLLYAAPILTFTRVVRRRSTEGFSCVPYIISLFKCLTYTWYGLPVVSYRWENFPIVAINGLGIVLESSFILIYFWFTPGKQKMKVGVGSMLVLLAFGINAAISAFVFHDHHHRKMFIGIVRLVASVATYGYPLVLVKQVIVTKNVEFMPFYLSLLSFLASSLWLAYGLLSHDLFLASPNLVGCLLGVIQMLVYCKYRTNRVIPEEPINGI